MEMGAKGPEQPPRTRRNWLTALVVVALAAVVLWPLARGAGLGGPGAAGGPPSPAPPKKLTSDWRHLGQVLVWFRAHPPRGTLVVLLGGSAARECTVSDESFAARLAAALAGGRGGAAAEPAAPLTALNLGTNGQSFDDDVAIVRRLPRRPRGQPTVVLIGVNFGRYTHKGDGRPSERLAKALALARADHLSALPPWDPETQHWYGTRVLPTARKQEIVDQWLAERLPVFERQFAANARALRRLVRLCQERGFLPVLVNLPLDLDAVGHRLDGPRARVAADCRAVAQELGVPWLDPLPQVRLTSRDFRDNWHLVESGRPEWEAWLAQAVASLLMEHAGR